MTGDQENGGEILGVSAFETGKLLFELPVYRVSQEQWRREKTEAADRLRRRYEAAGFNMPDRMISRVMEITHGAPSFPYNQTIGWLRLVLNGPPGPGVKAYAYQMKGSRYGWRFKPRPLEFLCREFELHFYADEDSEAIAKAIRSAVLGTVKPGGSFSGRWIDVEAFDTLAPVIDFPTLLELLHLRKTRQDLPES